MAVYCIFIDIECVQQFEIYRREYGMDVRSPSLATEDIYSRHLSRHYGRFFDDNYSGLATDLRRLLGAVAAATLLSNLRPRHERGIPS